MNITCAQVFTLVGLAVHDHEQVLQTGCFPSIAAYLLQHTVADSLAPHCWAHKHEPMAHQGGLIQLNAFPYKAVDCLQPHLLARVLDCLQQVTIVHLYVPLFWLFLTS